ncbi:MAG TPA: hypothetical protein VKT76_06235 [Bradyrhizobium sp.]|nr:hypothetical protein [Bradyrhizobium sp.]
MRRLQRLIAASVLIALSGALAGCSTSFSSFDPLDLLDWIDTKKKLPGDRKPVFPEGVPGLEQGVPKSLYKGAQQEVDQNAQTAAVAPPPATDTKPKRTAKSKGKQPDSANADPAAAPEEDATTAAPPPPKPKKIVRQRTTAPPPDQPADAPSASQPAQAAGPAQQSSAPFPAPLPGGTFTR